MNDGRREFRLAIYGYFVEVILAVAILWCAHVYGKIEVIVRFLESSAGAWATIFGIMLGGAMAARLVFFSLNSSDFAAWLEWRNVGGIVAGTFLFNLLFFFCAAVVSVALVYLKGTTLSKVALFLVIYGVLNAFTFSVFVYRLGRLHALFNLELRKANADCEDD
jgi:hypothetical protein